MGIPLILANGLPGNRLDAILDRADRTRYDTAEGMIGLVRALNA